MLKINKIHFSLHSYNELPFMEYIASKLQEDGYITSEYRVVDLTGDGFNNTLKHYNRYVKNFITYKIVDNVSLPIYTNNSNEMVILLDGNKITYCNKTIDHNKYTTSYGRLKKIMEIYNGKI